MSPKPHKHLTPLTQLRSINYYAPQIFAAIGLKGSASGLFATGIYGVVKVVVTALGLMLATEQLGRKVRTTLGGLCLSLLMRRAPSMYIPTMPARRLLTGLVVAHYRGAGPSVRNVLHRYQLGSQPSARWRCHDGVEHLLHRLRLPICRLLQVRRRLLLGKKKERLLISTALAGDQSPLFFHPNALQITVSCHSQDCGNSDRHGADASGYSSLPHHGSSIDDTMAV